MSAPARIRQADVRRFIKGALDAGLPPGSFSVKAVDGELVLLPVAANAPSDDAAEMERRIREAFSD